MTPEDYFDKTVPEEDGGIADYDLKQDYNPDDDYNYNNDEDLDMGENEPEVSLTPSDIFSQGGFIDYGAAYQKPPEERYDDIFDRNKPKNMTFSVISMVLGILSVFCCCITYFGLILAIGAVVMAIISKRILGYFDGFSIAGLILGIFGICFGALTVAISFIDFEAIFSELYGEDFSAGLNAGLGDALGNNNTPPVA